MKDNLSMVILMILLVLVMIMFPLYNYFERQDDMSYSLVLKATTNFAEEVMNCGYIDQDMYNRYINQISNTGNLYDIQLEAHRKMLISDSNNEGQFIERASIDYNDQIFETLSDDSSDSKDKVKTLSTKTIKNNIYKFDEGDEFYIKVKNSSTTMAGAIFNAIFTTSSKDRIVVNYGGIIKNNSWAKIDATYNSKQKYTNVIQYSTSFPDANNTLQDGDQLLKITPLLSGEKAQVTLHDLKKSYKVRLEDYEGFLSIASSNKGQSDFLSSGEGSGENKTISTVTINKDNIDLTITFLKGNITVTDTDGKKVKLEKLVFDNIKYKLSNPVAQSGDFWNNVISQKVSISTGNIKFDFSNIPGNIYYQVDTGGLSAVFEKASGSSPVTQSGHIITINQKGSLILSYAGTSSGTSITDSLGRKVNLELANVIADYTVLEGKPVISGQIFTLPGGKVRLMFNDSQESKYAVKLSPLNAITSSEFSGISYTIYDKSGKQLETESKSKAEAKIKKLTINKGQTLELNGAMQVDITDTEDYPVIFKEKK